MSAPSNAPRSIEASYGLSPMQEGMLFNSLYAPAAGVDVTQTVVEVEEPLDFQRLIDAWQGAIDRHPALRSAFRWEELDEPRQEVHAAVALPVEREDWSHLAEAERERRWVDLIEEDRRAGFDMARAPVLRLRLVRLGEGRQRVLWTTHHALLDGPAVIHVLQEVFASYDALGRGAPPPAEPVPPFRDYVEWLAELDASAAEAFWRPALAGLEAPTHLGIDRGVQATPPGGESRHLQRWGALSLELSARLVSWTREHGLTPNAAVQGAWAYLLSLYSGESKVVFGAPKNCRRSTVAGAERIVGVLMNTLPVVVDVDLEREVIPWLTDVRAYWLALREVEHTSLAAIQGWSELAGHRALFESILCFDPVTFRAAVEADGGNWERRRTGVTNRTNYPLTLNVYGGDEVSYCLTYDPLRFEERAVAGLLELFEEVLGAMVGGAARVRDLPSQPASERAGSRAPGAGASFPAEGTLHAGFEAQAARRPDAVALRFEGESISYGELNRRANRLAHLLRARGVGAGTAVGLALERGPEMVVGILGILKAGGAYVPLDLVNPAERVAFILEETAVPVLVTEEALVDRLPATAAELIRMDADAELLAAQPDDDPAPAAGPARAAYVIFTSGSTGKPKGVPIEHAMVLRLFAATQADYGFDERDVWTLFHSYAFDFSVWELWGALLFGGRLVVVPRGVSRSPEEFRALLADEGVTVLNQTPSAFRQLIAADGAAAGGELALRWVIFGGEALELESLRPWFERHGDQRPRLVNMYGITETTVHVTFRPLCAADLDAGVGSVIGRPIADLQVHVLDALRRPLPIGVPGEMYVGGAGVARGYLNRAELTAERFLPDPFRAGDDARLYRTGDVARLRADGDLEYLGRNDQQVKIRGFRIELGEIEAHLVQQPGVREAVVIAREDLPGDRRLVGYAVPDAGSSCAGDELRRALGERLPDYMVPAAVVVLDALPTTPNGKVDRRALPAPEGRPAGEDYLAPRDETEAALAAIWSELLQIEPIGARDDFFELGGHSLIAVQVISRVRAALGVELPLARLFEDSSLEGLARAVTEARATAPEEGALLAPVARDGELPLSFAQAQLWFLHRLAPDSSSYNIARVLRLEGPLDEEALRRALAGAATRHEVLRTIYPERGGRPVAVVREPGPVAFAALDLRDLDEQARAVELQRRVDDEVRRPFDLTAEAPLRVALLRLGEEDRVLVVAMHHIGADAWSLGLLNRELARLYRTHAGEASRALPDLPVQYVDYADWQRRSLAGEVLERHLDYWRETLTGAPTLALPTDHPRPPVQTFRGARVEVAWPRELKRGLDHLAQAEGATLYMVLLAAYGLVLSRTSGQADLCVGTPVANRSRTEVEDLIGCFLNMLTLRLDLAGDPPFRALLGRVRETVLGALRHQALPFERVVEELEPERDSSRNPLFQVAIALQNAPAEALDLPGVRARPFEGEPTTTRFDIELHLTETAQGLEGGVYFDRDLFEPATVERLVAHLGTALEAVVARPGARLSELPLLAEQERRRLVVDWNQTATDYPRERGVSELFEEQAARTPDAVALDFGPQQLSYRELDERAERLAARLREGGVSRAALVVIRLDRGVDFVVSALAVLKAGAAYVPLDPGLPAKRLALLLEDTGATVLIAAGGADPGADGFAGQVLAPTEGASSAGAPPAGEAGSAEDLAYVIYTSGSTGTPKGVAVPHRAIVRLVRDTDYVDLGPGDRVAQASIVSFDAATFEIWGALLNGASLVGLDREELLEPARLAEALRERRINTLFVTTALFNQLVAARADVFANLRTCLFGGEACDPTSIRTALESGPPEHLLHVYGPTENTTFSTWHRVREVPAGARTVPIGRPIANTTAYVLDPAGHPAPVGVPGELYLGGDGLARGYLNAPELTAERFVPHPFSADPGARLYKTGDRVRLLEDGAIEFVARIDHQLKIRGHRIEPGEIEAVLLGSPEVREAFVMAREDSPGDRRLVAYVVLDPTGADPAALSAFLRELLPAYMVPAAFVPLPALPLTPNGKVDRRALPAPGKREASAQGVAPRGETEAGLARIWGELLDVEAVGARDNFFELGGHSLLATQLVSRIRDEFEIELPLRSLFEEPTVAALAEQIDLLRASLAGAASEGAEDDEVLEL